MQRVCRIIPPDIAPPIGVSVDSIIQKRGRHKLGVTHRTRPRSNHVARRGIPYFEDLQRGKQLTFKERGAPSVKGKRGHRLDNIGTAAHGPIGRFQTLNRNNNFFVHAVCRFNRVHQIGIVAQRALPVLDTHVRYRRIEVVPNRL